MSELTFGTEVAPEKKKPTPKQGRKPNGTPQKKDTTLIGIRRIVHERVGALTTKTLHTILDTVRSVNADHGVSWYISEGNATPVVIEGSGLLWRFNVEIIQDNSVEMDIEESMAVSIITPLDLVSPMTARMYAEVAFVQALFALYKDFHMLFDAQLQAQRASGTQVAAEPRVGQEKAPTAPNIQNHPDKTHSTGFAKQVAEDLLESMDPDGVPTFKSFYDSPHDVTTNVGFLVSACDSFIQDVATATALQLFGDRNNEAFEYLKEFDKRNYDQLMNKVKAKWGALTGG